MREDICTIPVSEVFEENDGCPMCRMYNTVQERIIEYIMGAAMMEPEIRMVTNQKGFCYKHYSKMFGRKGRLQLALMLESHIDEINREILSDKLMRSNKSKGEKARRITDSCFVCEKIEWGISRMIETVYRSYETDMDFRRMFNGQEMFCMPHFELLVSGADKKKMKNYYCEFVKNLTHITQEYSRTLHEDVKHFCSMYDYRNSGKDADWGDSKDSVERTINFLTGNDGE
ncbi:MAG: DUF6062 family protein [Acutalibacteraceae bacterium]|nr:DUF6062 family protein [Acutalibacteraceae bacterium]